MSFKPITKDNLETALVENVELLQRELANRLPQEGRVKLTADLNAAFASFYNVKNYGTNSAYSNLLGEDLPLSTPFAFASTGTINSDDILQFLSDPMFGPLFDPDTNGLPLIRYIDVAAGATNQGTGTITSFTTNAVLEGDIIEDYENFSLFKQKGFTIPTKTHTVADPLTYYNNNVFSANVSAASIPSFDTGFTFSWWAGMRFTNYSLFEVEANARYAYMPRTCNVEYRKDNNSNISVQTGNGGEIYFVGRFGSAQVYEGFIRVDDYFPTDGYYVKDAQGKPLYYATASYVRREQYEQNVVFPLPKGQGREFTKMGRFSITYDPAVQATYPNKIGIVILVQINNIVTPVQLYPVSGTNNGASGLTGFRNKGVVTFNGGPDINGSIQPNSVFAGFSAWPRPLQAFEQIGAYYRGY